MPNRRPPSLGLLGAIVLGAVALAGACAPFDATPRSLPRGTLGEEIYKVVCERMALDAWPEDVTGGRSRALCGGESSPSVAPVGSRLAALAQNRDRLVAALDATLPEDLEDELESLLLQILPFYDPPAALLPGSTRAVAALLTELMGSDDATAALGAVSQRRGMRPQRHAVGITRPLLAYAELSDVASSTFALFADGGALEAEWSNALEAGALEMATTEPSPPDDPTLRQARDLLLRRDAAFGPERSIFVVARDARGLPIPSFVDGSEGFVDLDGDELADADALGRFLAADGSLLNPPTPFATVGETGVTRDVDGRARTAEDEPLYVYVDLERTVLAGLLREAPKLVDPAAPVIVDFLRGMLPMLGPDAERAESYGELEASYPGFDTEEGALFDVFYALAESLRYEETRDLLEVLRILLEDHEEELVALIEAGLFGDALGDAHPEIDLAPRSELWDDVIRVGQWMSETPGLLEALLRSFNHPDAQRLGPIFAETMRFKDIPTLNPADENELLDDVYWTVPVDRASADVPGNQSLFQQTLSGIHELDGAELCNKEGAELILDLDTLIGFGGVVNITNTLSFLGEGIVGPFPRCELLRIDNAARAFARAVIGREELVMNIAFLNAILDYFPGFGDIALDPLLELISGIDGFDRTPTPQALARLMYGSPNEFVNGLIDPPETIYGDVFRTRYPGQMVLAWERVFRFCGDRILDEGETCASPVEEVSLYDALSPMLEVLDDMDPLVDDDDDPSTPGRFLFAELVSSFHHHYATAANPMYQFTNPSGPRFVRPDGASTYEPIAANLMAGCTWRDTTGGGRTCATADAGRLLSRLARLTTSLDAVTIAPGVDGIDVAGAALEKFLNPANNPGLVNRAGASTTATNAGTRTLAMTPLHLLLDGLNRMDEAHDSDLARSERWYAARSRLVDLFLERSALPNDEFLFRNRRLRAAMVILVEFLAELVDGHVADGDLDAWAHTLDADFEDAVTGAMGSGLFRLLDALDAHEEAQTSIVALLAYLLDEDSPNDAFENALYTLGDLLFLLEDDGSTITLLRAFSNAFAVDAAAAAAGNATPSVESSALDEVVNLLAAVSEVDTNETFATVLRNAVTHPPGEPETPLEVIGDVIAEVNRATPNLGGPMQPNDYGSVMHEANGMLADPDRGFERVYDVVQSRELVP